MKTIKTTLLLVLVSMFLAACVSPPAAKIVAPARDQAELQLDAAIKLKAADKPVGYEVAVSLPVYGAKTTVSYLGDASLLLSNAAKGIGNGWVYQVGGAQPHLPIYVQVSVKEVGFAAFLTNVAEQLGQRADIELNANGKTIKLVYRSHN
jgi:uncharacterized lipoprotein YajG